MDSDAAIGITVLGVGAAAALALIGYFWWWCYRAWPRIWSPPRSAYDHIVFRNGVRGFGLMMWLALAVLLPIYHGVRGHEGPTRLVGRLALTAVAAFPMYLWLGYWWGRGMAAAFGVKDPARAA